MSRQLIHEKKTFCDYLQTLPHGALLLLGTQKEDEFACLAKLCKCDLAVPMTSPISGTCVGLYREHVTLWAKRCTAWASYPLVSKCIHCGSLKRWHANSSLQHARAAHITVAQVIYVEVQTNIFINKCILVRQLRKTWGRKQVYAILCLFFMLFVENSLPPIDNA